MGGGVVAASALLGWLLLAIAYGIPDSFVQAHIDESRVLIDEEGTYPSSYSTAIQYDNYTVRIMLNIVDWEDGNPFATALSSANYARYWHGYAIVLRLLFCFVSIEGMRRLFQFAFLTLLVLVSILLARRWGRRGVICAIALTTSYFAFEAQDAVASLPFFPSLFLSLVGALVVVQMKTVSERKISLLFVALGAWTAYFDFLDTPVLTFVVPASLFLVKSWFAGRKSSAAAFLLNCAGWLFGYGGMWASKWVLASVFLGVDVIGDALNQAAIRTGQTSVEGSSQSLISGLIGNVNAAGSAGIVIMIVLAVAIVLLILRWRREGLDSTSLTALALLMCAMVPYIWYVVLSNHSSIHWWFTYRNQIGSLLAAEMSIIVLLADTVRSRVVVRGRGDGRHAR